VCALAVRHSSCPTLPVLTQLPQKHGGCDGKHCTNRADLGSYNEERAGFTSLCSCLARNTECDERCACSAASGCLNRSVTARDTVKLGSDVQEVDSWGMDCYVRRNILDGGCGAGAGMDCGCSLQLAHM